MPVMDRDGFSFVFYKGKKKNNVKKSICSIPANDLQNFHTVIENIQDELKHCDFTTKFSDDFQNVLNEWDCTDNVTSISENTINSDQTQEIDIVCYGLGQFSSCIIARYQLGFLLYLKCLLKSSNVYVYDPQFSTEEKDFLSELKLNVLNINEEAKRKVEKKTIFFMPHCDLPLYNNLLWANWSIKNLSCLAIIGNSFQSYEINNAKSHLQSKAKYVKLSNKFLSEIKMSNCFRFTDIFNDLSIHYFQSSSVSEVESYIWTDKNEPEYSDDDDVIKNC